MNKIFSLVAAFAVVALVSCGGHKEEAAAGDSTTVDTAAAAPAETAVDTAAHADTAAAPAAEAHH